MGEATVTQLDTIRRRTSSQVGDAQSSPLVADIANATVLRLPGWFTVAQARRVAQLKRVSHVLVEDRGQISGSVSTTVLGHAPDADALARWSYRTSAHVAPDATVAAAGLLLHEQGASCLPVVTAGGLLVGTISVHDIALASEVGEGLGHDHDVRAA
jgi:Mg/Co/Ni transporter MgtE